MENVLSQLTADQLEIKLTDEKLFINTPTSNEAFALRSINGIGVIDLLDDFNNRLTLWKKAKIDVIVFFVGGGLIAFIAFYLFTKSAEFGLGMLALAGLTAIPGFLKLKVFKMEPKLMSAVRIMMSGGNRDFKFDKTGVTSGNVAEFVAKVESTLTSYHKNHE